ncbi:MAG: low specificity L-threonine aldolase [Planctomycetes bacterium]|nr:low specificity L-threonine aldolase [Planctomycetota bacterium]
MTPDRICFASDNYAGTCPEAWAALAAANAGHAIAYGDDRHTAAACTAISELFGCACDVYFVFNGTAANALALASLCQSYHSVICPDSAHVETDECGAPEFFSNGSKLLCARSLHGKVLPESVAELATRRSDIHFPKPRVLSITQSTEAGTVYTPDEVQALHAVAVRHGLKLHMDGARFANAVASLGCHPADITWRAGVDVLCFGGTKQGLPVGEAVVFFDRGLSEDFAWRCKQAGQLASKMRFLAAPWPALLDGAWLRHAGNANACAARLGTALAKTPGVELLHPVEANAVFARLPAALSAGLRARGWRFYDFLGGGGARFVCGWDCRQEWVDELVGDLRDLAAGA